LEQIVDKPEVTIRIQTLAFSDDHGDLVKALAEAQAQFSVATKDKKNPHFGSNFTSFKSMVKASRAILLDHGLLLMQAPSNNGNNVTVTSRLIHVETCQWCSCSLSLRCRDDGPQSIGSGVSYGLRYTYAPMIGLVLDDDDDDGNVAQGREMPSGGGDPRRSKSKPKPKQKPKPKPVDNRRTKLWDEIMSRVEGDETAARDLLKELTTFVPSGKTEAERFTGYRNISAVGVKMCDMAGRNLKDHSVFGDAALGLGDDGKPERQDAAGPPLKDGEVEEPPTEQGDLLNDPNDLL